MPMDQKFKFILASQSPRRKELIGHLQIPFEIISPTGDELSEEIDPQLLAQELALRKAKEVEQVAQKKFLSHGTLVLAADTVVALDGQLLGKPQGVEQAREMLNILSGRTHLVCTGVCLSGQNDMNKFEKTWVAVSKVCFRQFTPDILELYLKTGESLDKAGAYGIQGAGLLFVESVEGSYSNVVGLPLDQVVVEVKNMLNLFGVGKQNWQNVFI